MKKRKNKQPMVSSVSNHIKHTSYKNGEKVTTKEETVKRKQGFLDMLDILSGKIYQNIVDDKIELTNTMDIERLIKLTLLVSGEADSIKGRTDAAQLEHGIQSDAKLTMSQIEQILDIDDPEVMSMYEKLYRGYNEINDKED